jgi:hypothetical protein
MEGLEGGRGGETRNVKKYALLWMNVAENLEFRTGFR